MRELGTALIGRSHTGVMVYAGIVALIWALHAFGLFRITDGLIHDHLGELRPEVSGPRPRVLWLRADLDSPTTDWSQLADDLLLRGAALLVFPRPPHGALPPDGRIVVGRLLDPDPDDPVLHHPRGAVAPAPGSAPPPAVLGMHREQWSRHSTPDGVHPALEVAAARILGVAEPGTDRYRVDFASGPVPSIELRQVEAGAIPATMLIGHVLVFGPGIEEAALHTPLRNTPIAPAHYHALALRTLLDERLLVVVGPWRSLVAVALAVLVSLLAIQRLGRRHPRAMLGLLVVLVALVTWLFQQFAAQLLPASALLLGSVLAYAEAMRLRGSYRDARVRALANAAAARWSGSRVPEGFDESQQHWEHVADMVGELVSCRRQLFLAVDRDKQRVQEIVARGCDFSEVSERRRDYRRKPYSDAIERQGPLELIKPFVSPDGKPETQFMLSLEHQGILQGFWFLSVSPPDPEERAMLLATLDEIGEQCSALLHDRERRQHEARRNVSAWRRLLRLSPEQPAEQLLAETLETVSQRLALTEAVLESEESGVVVYDLFGRVLHVNQRAVEVLEHMELRPYEITASTLIAELTGKSTTDACGMLRYLVMERGRLTYPITGTYAGKAWAIGMHALASAEQDSARHPFQVRGLLLELVDVTAVRTMVEFKDRLMQHVGARFRNDLEALTISCGLMSDVRMDEARRTRVVSIVKQKIDDMAEITRQIQQLAEHDIGEAAGACYPVDIRHLLDGVLREVEELAKDQGVHLEVMPFADYLPLALADPGLLERALGAMLRVLVEDAGDGGHVTVRLGSGAREHQLHFTSDGLGLPQERLEEYLVGHEELASEPLKVLRDAARAARRWGGRLDAQSTIGEGIAFTLHLKTFA